MTHSSLPGRAILIIDREPEELKAIKLSLAPYGFTLNFASDGEQAVALFREVRPELVLTTLNQPQNNTSELCRRIKVENAPGFLPIILIVDAAADGPQASAEANADDFLVRPIREAELLTRVGILLRIKREHDLLWEQNQSLLAELEKRNAELERALKEVKEASVLRDSIVQNVSHELRTPLLQVKSAVAMLAEDARAASPNGASVLADHATAATARLESVVQNISQLAASVKVTSEAFRVVDAVNIALRQLRRQWASSSAVDRIQIQMDNIPLVLGDRGGLAQVLQQLIDNGIKFSPNGGTVEVIGERCPGGVRVSVRDHGIGIPEDQIGRIFQAFYQVDSSTTRTFGGTGVGLAIAKLILDKMGTTIAVESRPDIGSTFSFMLPTAPEPTEPIQPETSPESAPN
jgi:signal transduction histidine kinase